MRETSCDAGACQMLRRDHLRWESADQGGGKQDTQHSSQDQQHTITIPTAETRMMCCRTPS
jgi:hypothetical protein